jgi:hypothetical protein
MYTAKTKRQPKQNYKKGTRHPGPKEKETDMFGVAISPNVECRLLAWLGHGAHQAELLLEHPLPHGEAGLCIVKNDGISLYPNGPTDYYKDFSEDSSAKTCSGFNDHV